MIYRFDDFQLNPATRELRRRDQPIALPARAFDCLAYLIEHRERAVGRDELIAAVWGRVEISETLLGHTLVKLRRSLGDTGNEQRTIRTVPRFGYRWALPVEVEAAAGEAPDEAVASAARNAVAASDIDAADVAPAVPEKAPLDTVNGVRAVVAPARMPRPRRAALLAIAGLLLIGAVLGLWHFASRVPPLATAPATQPGDAAPPASTPAAVSVLVLPAEVAAAEDWRWLRLGVMDLIANRVRSAAVQTAPSETVVGLLKQRGGDGDLLHDGRLADVAALRVLPHVGNEGGRWTVRLEAFGAQRAFSVEAEGDDAIATAREAADALLQTLGRTPGVSSASEDSPALDALLQRSGAAMLADQLDQARALIAQAPADLQNRPAIEQRMAQIDLRSGNYAGVETRLHALLDRLSPSRDAALRARALLTLAAAYVRSNQEDKAADLYTEAIALRQQPPDHEVLGVAYLGRGAVLAQDGHYEEATAELSRARTELGTVGDGIGVASVDVNLGDFQLMRHRPADALAALRDAAAQFERLGAREGRAHALLGQAIAEGGLLDYAAAMATTARLWPPEANTNNLRMRWNLVFARAQALAGGARLDAAQALIERIRRETEAKADAVVRLQAEALAAEIALQRGDPAQAATLIVAALKPALREADPIAWTRALLVQARSLRASGQVAAAGDATAALRTWAQGEGDDWRTLYANLAGAEQAWAEHRREAALEQFAKAWAAAGRANVPEDVVEVGSIYLAALVDASQLDSARAVGGRIAPWADRDLRAADAEVQLFRALGHDEAMRSAEAAAARLRALAAAPVDM